MKGNKYLGIAGTRPGTSPQVYAALSVMHPEEITRIKGLREIYYPRQIEEFLKSADYAYIFVPPEFKKEFGEQGLHSIVLAEFLLRFPTTLLAIIEAPVMKKAVVRAQDLVAPHEFPRVKQVPEGRFEYVAVNNAYHVAQFFQEQHCAMQSGRSSVAIERARLAKRVITLDNSRYAHIKRPEKRKKR